MLRRPHLKKEILQAILEIKRPATVGEIEKHVPLERHTLSKYLNVMKNEGLLTCESVGPAKIWRVNKAPLATLLKDDAELSTYAEKVLSLLLKNIPAGIIVLDEEYEIQYINQILENSYGACKQKKFYKVFLGEDNPLSLGILREVVSGELHSAVKDIVDKNGNIYNIRASSLKNPDDSYTTMMIVDNITYRQKVEENLRRSENKYKTLVEASSDGICLLSKDLEIIYASNPLIQMLGYDSKQELLEKSATDFFIEEKTKVEQHIQRIFDSDKRLFFNSILKCKDGTESKFAISCSTVSGGIGDTDEKAILCTIRSHGHASNYKLLTYLLDKTDSTTFEASYDTGQFYPMGGFDNLHSSWKPKNLKEFIEGVKSDDDLEKIFKQAIEKNKMVETTYTHKKNKYGLTLFPGQTGEYVWGLCRKL